VTEPDQGQAEKSSHPWSRGHGFLEGPVVVAEGVLTTSMDRGELLLFGDDEVRKVLEIGGGPNGLAVGAGGKVYVAQNGAKPRMAGQRACAGGVQVVSRDFRSVSWLSQYPSAPNDLCVGADEMLYVTDPVRPGTMFSESRLWRVDPGNGNSELLAVVDWFANGIAFGADGALWVADTQQRRVVRFACDARGLGQAEPLIDTRWALPDGLAVDEAGHIMVAGISDGERPGALLVFTPDGELVSELKLGPSRRYTNLTIGSRNEMYVTDADEGTLVRYSGWPYGPLP
jgi:gluconolactonase